MSSIHYLPVIDAPATDYATISTVLEKAVTIADSLQLPAMVVVFDQAIYSKAQIIRWKSHRLCQRTVLRLGEFHTTMSFLSVIGKRFAHSGLEDILIEAGVIAPGSVKTMMTGHMYNRAVRCHKLMYEALGRMQMDQFLESHNVDLSFYDKESATLDKEKLASIHEQFQKYRELQSQQSSLYSFWCSYMKMVEILLNFIRATRTADWCLHLASLKMMLPWFFAYDRTNYAR